MRERSLKRLRITRELCGTAAGTIPLLAVIAILCGCSTFNRDWRRAAASPPDQQSAEGRWEGRWISEVNGHHGGLRCLMEQEDNAHFHARFRATYAGIFHFGYTVPLEMQPHDLGWEFNGEADLGKMAGGTYYYEGRATTTNLFSTYKSSKDHGRFELKRPVKP